MPHHPLVRSVGRTMKPSQSIMNDQPAKSNHPEIPDSSLLSQVAGVIDNGTACDREPRRMAGDVIRAVAAWLQKNYGRRLATIDLEQEAER